MPNQPKTPQRTVRVPDEVWDAAKAKATERGDNLSDVIRRALYFYADKDVTEKDILLADTIEEAAALCDCRNCVICRAARLPMFRNSDELWDWCGEMPLVLVDGNRVVWTAYVGHDGDPYLRTVHDPTTEEGYPAGDSVIAAFNLGGDVPTGVFPLAMLVRPSQVGKRAHAIRRHLLHDIPREEYLALLDDDLDAWYERGTKGEHERS